MNEEENIEELKRLLYTNTLTQYGKRKLINYYEKEIEKLQKENELAKQTLIKNCDIADERNQLLKENEELKEENNRLKVIKYDIDYGIETVNLIPKSTLVEVNTNKYMIEIEDGKFIDLKQIYQENKTLKELHIQDNKHLDFIMKNSIPIQKVKDKIQELKQERISKYDRYMGYKIESREQQDIDKKINILQELIEESEEK